MRKVLAGSMLDSQALQVGPMKDTTELFIKISGFSPERKLMARGRELLEF
jgi:hypothetical protein